MPQQNVQPEPHLPVTVEIRNLEKELPQQIIHASANVRTRGLGQYELANDRSLQQMELNLAAAKGSKHLELALLLSVVTDIRGRTDFTSMKDNVKDITYDLDLSYISHKLHRNISLAARTSALQLSTCLIVDSGCNNPVVHDLSLLKNVRKPLPGEVNDFIGPGDQVFRVTRLGSLEIMVKTDTGIKQIVIANCRYCPTMQVNLLPEAMLPRKNICGILQPNGSKDRFLTFDDGSRCKLSKVDNLFALPLNDINLKEEWKRTGGTRSDMAAVLTVQLEHAEIHEDQHDTDRRLDLAALLAAPPERLPKPGGKLSERLWNLHLVLGHPSAFALGKTAQRMGWKITEEERLALRKFNHSDCPSCALSKHTKVAAKKTATPRNYKKGDKISTDWLPIGDEAIGGLTGAWILVDRATRAPYVYPCRKKTEFLDSLQQYLVDAGLNQNGRYAGPKIIQSDRDSVVCSKESRQFYAQVLGCEIQTSAPNVHSQNYSESVWKTLKHKLIATMRESGAPPRFWAHAMRNVAAGMRVTMGSTSDKLPLELQFPEIKVRVEDETPYVFGQTGVMPNWNTTGWQTPAGKHVRYLCKSKLSKSVVVYNTITKRTSETNAFRPTCVQLPWDEVAVEPKAEAPRLDDEQVVLVEEHHHHHKPKVIYTYNPFSLTPYARTQVPAPPVQLQQQATYEVKKQTVTTETNVPDADGDKSTTTSRMQLPNGDSIRHNSFASRNVGPPSHTSDDLKLSSIDATTSKGTPTSILSAGDTTFVKGSTHAADKTTVRDDSLTDGDSFTVGEHKGKLFGKLEDFDESELEDRAPKRNLLIPDVPDYTPITGMKKRELTRYHAELGADTPAGDLRMKQTYIDAIRQHREKLFNACEINPSVEKHDIGLNVFDAFGSHAVENADGTVNEKLSTVAMHDCSKNLTSVPPQIQTAIIEEHDPDILTVDQVKSLFGHCNGLAPTPLTYLVKECCREGLIDPKYLLTAAQRKQALADAKRDQEKYDTAHIHTVLARSMTQAKTLPNWESAILQAHTKEMNKLAELEVFEMVPITTVAKRELIQSFINYTAVLGPDGSINKYKARFLGKGYSQVEDVNYFDTAASTTQDSTWRSIVTLCAAWDWDVLCCDDVEGAFLNAEMKEKVFLRFPKDMRETNSEGIELVARLKKALYGLKQSSRAFQDQLAGVFKKLGYRRSKYDTTVFFRMIHKSTGKPVEPNEKGTVLDQDDKRPEPDIYDNYNPKHHDLHIMSTHVDDILHACSSQDMYDNWRVEMQKHFTITGSDNASWYLNMVFERDRSTRTITVSQKALVETLAEKFPFLKTSSGVKTPLPPGTVFGNEHSPLPGQENRKMQADYRSALGVLLYVSVKTRMDISQAVSAASRVMSNPGEQHWKMMMHLLRYTYHTRDRVLKLGGQNCEINGPFALQAYTDSDWGGDPSRKSTSGGQIQLMGGLIWYKSKLQATIARSTAHAELAAASLVAAEVVHLRNLLAELHHAQRTPTMIQCDNQGSIKVSHNPTIGQRLKHVDMMDLWVRELCEQGKVYMTYIATTENPADVLTKALSKELFRKHVSVWYRDRHSFG